jgi:hypothetical protein
VSISKGSKSLLGLVLGLPALAVAELPPVHTDFETAYGDIAFWGIASQAYVFTDRHSFFGSRDDPFGYREIALGGQYKPFACCSLTVQGEYRDAGESDNLGVRLGQAFADGHWSATEDTILGANLGRIEVPFALYNATRDRVDTRPSIFLPPSIYLEGTNFRDVILTGDGAMVYGLHQLTKKARIESKVAVVQSSFGDVPGLQDALLVSGWLDYVWDDVLRLRISGLHSEKDGTQLTYPVLSAQYRWDKWTFTGEAGRLQFDTPRGSVGTTGWYGQAEYAATKDLSLFARYDRLRFSLENLAVPVDIPEDRLRAQSFTVGAAYQITKNIRLNGEYSFTDGTANLNGAENRDIEGGDYSTLGAVLSIRF